MPDLKTLREEMERAYKQASAILEANPNGLSGEHRVDFDRWKEKAQALHTQIEAEQKLADDKRDLGDLDRFLTAPQRRLPHGVNGDDDDRKALLDRGWECKGGGWYAPTTNGLQAMYPNEVLFGPIPEDDPATARYVKMVRAAMSEDYAQVYVKHLRLAARHGDASVAYSMLAPAEQKALSEGSETAGGFLVPPDTQAEVLSRVAQQAVVRGLARVVNTSRDILRFPAVAPNASSGSIYSSGFVGGWAGETPAFSDTDPSFQLFDIPIKKLRVATRLSNDFIADATVNVLAWLAQNGAENMALVEDSGFINGDGTPLQPLGVLNSGVSTVDVEGSTTDTISNTTAATGSAPKLLDVYYGVPAQYASKGVWLMRRAIEGKVRKLTDAQGRYMWLAAGTMGGFENPAHELMGARVYNSDFMPTDGTNGNKVMVYGDLSQYIIAQRAQITSVVLRERFADTDQTGIILFERVGGALWNIDALRIGIV